MFLILLLSIIGFSFYLSRSLQLPLAKMPLLIICLWINVFYSSAIFQLSLNNTAYILFVPGVILLLIECWKCRTDLRSLMKRSTKPGFLLFLLLSSLLWIRLHNASYGHWDEFSHWGLIVKEMMISGGLVDSEGISAFKQYPPATSLFEYFVSLIVGYSEGSTYLAQALLIVAAICSLLSENSWKRWPVIVLSLMGYLVALTVLGQNIKSLLVDHVLGLLFGVAIAGYYQFPERSWRVMLAILPLIFLLPLIKPVGLLFSIFIGLIVLLDQFKRLKSGGFSHKYWIGSVVIIILMLVLPFIADASWKWSLEQRDITSKANTSISQKNVFASIVNGEISLREKQTLANFAEALVKKGVGRADLTSDIGISPGVLFVTIWYFVYTKMKKVSLVEKGILFQTNILMSLCCIIYLYGLMQVYLYGFGDFEGLSLASFGRYTGILFLAWTIILISQYAKDAIGSNRIVASAIAIVLSIGISIYAFQPDRLPEGRKKVNQVLPPISTLVETDKKTWIIWQNTGGFEHLISRYELAPRKVNHGSWSLGKPYEVQDVWSQEISCTEWSNRLIEERYDFVWIAKADDAFWKAYRSLFADDDKREGLYIIQKTFQGNVLLRSKAY